MNILMSGGSRGIGLAIAKRMAREGASVAILAKTAEPHPKLPGTIHTAAAEIEEAGGKALAIVGDVRDAEVCARAAKEAAEAFGGLDAVVNNASAIDLRGMGDLPLKSLDLMLSVNFRGTFALTQAALPWLRESSHAHVLTLSPPLRTEHGWYRSSAYAVAKFAMTITTLGLAEEFRSQGIAGNCLWPKTTIATAAVANLLGGEELMAKSRTPELYADAAGIVLERPPRECTANAYLCEDVLAEEGIIDLAPYAFQPGQTDFATDLFVGDPPA